MKGIKFVGLDVHAETISVAVAEQDGEIRSLGMIPNREESIRKLRQNLKARSPFRLSRRVPRWVRYVHQVRILNLVLLILQISFCLLLQRVAHT